MNELKATWSESLRRSGGFTNIARSNACRRYVAGSNVIGL